MARNTSTFEDRLARIPQDREVFYSLQQSPSTSKLYWRARLTDDLGKRRCQHIGDDKDGIIAARAAASTRPRRGPKRTSQDTTHQYHTNWEVLPTVPDNFNFTTVYDEKGQPLVIDADLDLYFQGHDFAKRIYVRGDGSRYVIDYGFHNPFSIHAEPKEVPLENFIWTIWNQRPVPARCEVIHKHGRPDDFRIRELEVVRKQQPQRSA